MKIACQGCGEVLVAYTNNENHPHHLRCSRCIAEGRLNPPPLKSVDEHNTERRHAREEAERKARMTGVACPKCGKELEWSQPYAFRSLPMTTTSPARCGSCTLTVELER